jgi:hypothetical protein
MILQKINSSLILISSDGTKLYTAYGTNIAVTTITNLSSSQLTNFYTYNINNNIWNHITWIIQASGVYNYFINGNLVYTISSVLYPTLITRTSNYFGKSNMNLQSFNGSIDDFRFYNRILSSSEIYSLYSNNLLTTVNNNYVFSNNATTANIFPKQLILIGQNVLRQYNTLNNANFKKFVSTLTDKISDTSKSKTEYHFALAIVSGGEKEYNAGQSVYLHLGLFDVKNFTWRVITKIEIKKGNSPLAKWEIDSQQAIHSSIQYFQAMNESKK